MVLSHFIGSKPFLTGTRYKYRSVVVNGVVREKQDVEITPIYAMPRIGHPTSVSVYGVMLC